MRFRTDEILMDLNGKPIPCLVGHDEKSGAPEYEDTTLGEVVMIIALAEPVVDERSMAKTSTSNSKSMLFKIAQKTVEAKSNGNLVEYSVNEVAAILAQSEKYSVTLVHGRLDAIFDGGGVKEDIDAEEKDSKE